MFLLVRLLIVALVPIDSSNWLALDSEGSEFYPAPSTLCFFKQLPMNTYSQRGLKIRFMVFSVCVVGTRYVYSGVRLFEPDRRSLENSRTLPGSPYILFSAISLSLASLLTFFIPNIYYYYY
ncbi:hypothetical protein GQ43DRAFT_255713 [Delitschia confertaspora ATCC 74209]|uniref:G-protein coupled receptors family 1 profile domain-containing protein n=1 Tax=Delitschia confertaspora ATCC 74209 TaxID=1513339 RepID=A0A9P4JFT1_9PLEO|nr:hypothetical protein GQ43DRAFT_255713 [Delitschia confertaspora ATCC 74209]